MHDKDAEILRLKAELRDYQMAASAEADEVDRRGAELRKLRAMMDHSFGGENFVVYGTAAAVAELERRLASTPGRINYEVSQTTQALIDLLVARDRAGRAKYGATLDRADLTHEEWLQHMAEELLDGAGYALSAKRVTSVS